MGSAFLAGPITGRPAALKPTIALHRTFAGCDVKSKVSQGRLIHQLHRSEICRTTLFADSSGIDRTGSMYAALRSALTGANKSTESSCPAPRRAPSSSLTNQNGMDVGTSSRYWSMSNNQSMKYEDVVVYALTTTYSPTFSVGHFFGFIACT